MSAKLELLRELPKRNWPLTPWLRKPPTIEKYKKDPSKWHHEIYAHGIYALTFNVREIRSWADGDTVIWPDVTGDYAINLQISVQETIEAAQLGNWIINGPEVTMIGYFDKNGSTIKFYPLKEAL